MNPSWDPGREELAVQREAAIVIVQGIAEQHVSSLIDCSDARCGRSAWSGVTGVTPENADDTKGKWIHERQHPQHYGDRDPSLGSITSVSESFRGIISVAPGSAASAGGTIPRLRPPAMDRQHPRSSLPSLPDPG